MAKKSGGVIPQNEAISYNGQGISDLLRKMVSHPEEFKQKKLGDYLALHATDIKAALTAGINVGEIAKQFRDGDLLEVSDAAMRKFVKDAGLAPVVGLKASVAMAKPKVASHPQASAKAA